MVAASIAVVELVALIVLGVLVLGKDWFSHSPAHAGAKTEAAAHVTPASTKAEPQEKPAAPTAPTQPILSRAKTGVLVLNGNGQDGAAGAKARIVRVAGYPVIAVENAKRTDYGRDIVMYRPGYGREARRLARDLGIPVVSALDGLWPSELKTAKLALIVGS
jgi:hypothetical protein